MKSIYKISLIALSFLSLSLVSCNDKEEKKEQTEEPTATNSAQEMKSEMAQEGDTKYNPAHGVEGHRCDLPVGAPLNNAAASTPKQMTSSPVRMQSATPQINPPHGEPGHDCSVAVGAELN